MASVLTSIRRTASVVPFSRTWTEAYSATTVRSPGPARTGTVCITIRYRGIDAPSAAHIHEGPPTVAGPVVIDFGVLIATSPAGQITGCVPVEPALAADVGQNPSDYYVNVHNAAFPGGAIRGQLRG